MKTIRREAAPQIVESIRILHSYESVPVLEFYSRLSTMLNRVAPSDRQFATISSRDDGTIRLGYVRDETPWEKKDRLARARKRRKK